MHPIADRADARAGLVPRADLGDVESVGRETRLHGVDVRDLPGESAESIRLLGRRRHTGARPDLDGEPAESEEEEPDTPFLEGLVEGEADPETVAIERERVVGRRTHDHHVVETVDPRLGPLGHGRGFRGEAEKARLRRRFDDDLDGELPRRGGRDRVGRPGPIGTGPGVFEGHGAVLDLRAEGDPRRRQRLRRISALPDEAEPGQAETRGFSFAS